MTSFQTESRCQDKSSRRLLNTQQRGFPSGSLRSPIKFDKQAYFSERLTLFNRLQQEQLAAQQQQAQAEQQAAEQQQAEQPAPEGQGIPPQQQMGQ